MRIINTIGAASCIAGNRMGCSGGPEVLRRSGLIGVLARRHGLQLDWQRVLQPLPELETEAALVELCGNIRRRTKSQVLREQPFLFMGGDHACAMGVWGGVLNALRSRRDFGLIWIDAHMDAHTFHTTSSGNIHGMPVAALLGRADKRLAAIYGEGPTIDPSRLVLIGVRSFEPAEQRLLQQMNVTVYSMQRVQQAGGLGPLMGMVLTKMRRRSRYYGISIDLDAMDPDDAPGVGTPVSGGLSGRALCRALTGLGEDPALIGLEIAEFNPLQDQGHRTARLVEQLVGAVYGARWSGGSGFKQRAE